MPRSLPIDHPTGLDVRFEGVTKAFGDRVVLDAVELAIPAGQFVAIVGRSGGGKTTLVRLIAGLDSPTAGAIRLGDAPLLGISPAVRLLFQDTRLLPWHRVLSNVGIARGRHWRARAQQALEDVGLADRAHDWPSVLSGGQRARVALARALVSHPSVLLLDEPFGALDALTRVEMHSLLLALWQRLRFTVILITHDVGEAAALADRVLVLKDGRVAFDQMNRAARPRTDEGTAAFTREILAAV